MDDSRIPQSVEVRPLESPVIKEGDTLFVTQQATLKPDGTMEVEPVREAWVQRSDDALENYPDAF